MKTEISDNLLNDPALQRAPVTDSIIVIRLLRNGVGVFTLGEEYVLNHENVFCLATKHADGSTWYSYGGKLNRRTLAERDDLAVLIRGIVERAKERAR